MVDMNIEFLAVFVIISVLFPILMLIFFKQEKRIMLDMTMIIIGIFWFMLFGFTIDNIIVGYNETGRNYNATSGNVTITNEPITVPLIADDGSPTEYRLIFLFFSAIWIFIGMFSEFDRRRG